jgi:hypothetical protein
VQVILEDDLLLAKDNSVLSALHMAVEDGLLDRKKYFTCKYSKPCYLF